MRFFQYKLFIKYLRITKLENFFNYIHKKADFNLNSTSRQNLIGPNKSRSIK